MSFLSIRETRVSSCKNHWGGNFWIKYRQIILQETNFSARRSSHGYIPNWRLKVSVDHFTPAQLFFLLKMKSDIMQDTKWWFKNHNLQFQTHVILLWLTDYQFGYSFIYFGKDLNLKKKSKTRGSGAWLA